MLASVNPSEDIKMYERIMRLVDSLEEYPT